MTTTPVALVTGAGGFIGQRLCAAMDKAGWTFDVVTRQPQVAGARKVYPSLAHARDHLAGVGVIFHLAGLAHDAVSEAGREDLFQTNVVETTQLYAAAADAHVDLFVHLSSIRVLGDSTESPWENDAPLEPSDAYAESKAQAEIELQSLGQGNRTNLAIVRPPIVYGPGVKANFLNLMKIAHSGWPLPLGGATAQRSWLGVQNLVDFLLQLGSQQGLQPDSGLGQRSHLRDDSNPDERVVVSPIWHVRDREESSVADMLCLLRQQMSKTSRLWPVNAKLALAVGRLVGLSKVVNRLYLPQRVDTCGTFERLGWQPPYSQHEAIAETVEWFQARS